MRPGAVVADPRRNGGADTREPGPILFARYAYPPNALGYCGPPDSGALIGAAAPATDLDGLSRLAARFEGAWPYLRLIARCNGIADPLDPRVVEAYWVGNELLLQVPASALRATVDDCFASEDAQGPGAAVSPGRGHAAAQLSRLRRLPVARAPACREGRPTTRGSRPLPDPLGARRSGHR